MAKQNPYKLTIGGQSFVFPDKKAYDKYKALMDLFTPRSDGSIPHTNLEPGVVLSKDNPISEGIPSKVGMGTEIILKEISDEEWDKKYKSLAPATAPKVAAVNPHMSKFKKKREERSIKQPSPPKTWDGPPYTEEEMEAQNQRYTFAKSNSASPSSDCLTCGGVTGMHVMVTDCDGNGFYHFPCATFEGNTPTAAILGTPVSCAGPGNQYYQPCGQTCWGSQWIPVQLAACVPTYPLCSILKQDPNCAGNPPINTCATPFAASIVSDNNFFSTEPVYEDSPTNLDTDLTIWPGPGGPPPWSFQCDYTTLVNNTPVEPPVYPYTVMPNSPVWPSQGWAYYEILNYYTVNMPNLSIRAHRWNMHPNNCYMCNIICDNVYDGISYKTVWINYFYPSFINADPVTGDISGASPSSLQPNASGGFYYDTWTEMMDDLIAAGEYSGSNTDPYIDVWNAGIVINFQANGCTNCNPAPPPINTCKVAGQS